MDLHTLAQAILATPALNQFDFQDICLFVRLTSLLCVSIAFETQAFTQPPLTLPSNVVSFFGAVLNIKATPTSLVAAVQGLWGVFKEIVWGTTGIEASAREIDLVTQYGIPLQLSLNALYPPSSKCLTHGCKYSASSKKLLHPVTFNGTLFTIRNGAIPIISTSYYCPECNTRYHANYSVHAASDSRTYYGGVPDIVQVGQHFFLEAALLELIAIGKVFGWISSMNFARIYNQALHYPDSHIHNNSLAYSHTQSLAPQENETSSNLREEDVLNGFFLFSLLLEYSEHSQVLVLPNSGTLKDGLEHAMADRSKSMEGTGQENWNHACDTCFVVVQDPNDPNGGLRKIQTAGCDGITIGHARCQVHDCKTPLQSKQDHFCLDHHKNSRVCRVEGCSQPCAQNSQACCNSEHSCLEQQFTLRGQSHEKAYKQLQKAGISVPLDSVVLESDETVDSDLCLEKPEAGNQKLRTKFSRLYTHNEQIIVRLCGVIIVRATFWGSEAISAVNTFMKCTFPTKKSTPEYFVYDSACRVLAHQQTNNDNYFSATAQVVDVFHFESHKDSDTICQQNCNPKSFPELTIIGKDGKPKWLFNTSICEQTNTWLGGYHAILREMHPVQYNFYLDEVIKRQNRYIIQTLDEKGMVLWSIPLEALLD